jgi:hypothetical protein
MSHQDKNLRRALAILSTEPNDDDVRFGFNRVIVAYHDLDLDNPDDCEVLSILMANREFGFAVTWVEKTAKRLRDMQEVWSEAAHDLMFEEI